MGARIIIDKEKLKQQIKIKQTLKELCIKFNCGRDFMRKYLLQHDLYEEFCLTNNRPVKMKKQYCCICNSDNQINMYQGKPYCKKHVNHMIRYGQIIEKTIYDKNDYIFENNIVKIILRDKYQNINGYSIIDKEDYEKVKECKWYLSHGYCKTKTLDKDNGISIQNLIMDNLDFIDIIYYDHIDRNRLNNKKDNLRRTTLQQNSMNMSKKYINTSGVSGVQKYTYDKELKWDAYITYKYKPIYLGRFIKFDDAVLTRLKGEVEYFKERSPNYNKFSNNIELTYISKDDKLQKYIEINMNGDILQNKIIN